eukprot:TRINITY_DN1338_c0_g1_i1.p2 TRINITY_DN1338_c0_g1~~TRINITY_DN1338_c0_g1_i1.p2  ORF type:complete len:127 (-),score=24.34 TRINITY_DN1338_c0_g1_i1:138-518(-)
MGTYTIGVTGWSLLIAGILLMVTGVVNLLLACFGNKAIGTADGGAYDDFNDVPGGFTGTQSVSNDASDSGWETSVNQARSNDVYANPPPPANLADYDAYGGAQAAQAVYAQDQDDSDVFYDVIGDK